MVRPIASPFPVKSFRRLFLFLLSASVLAAQPLDTAYNLPLTLRVENRMQAGLKQAPFLLAERSGVTQLKLFYCNI